MACVTWPNCIILRPPLSVEFGKGSNFKFGVHCADCSPGVLFKKCKKIGQMGAWTRSRDLFVNFGILSTSLEWIKLETSNFVCSTLTFRRCGSGNFPFCDHKSDICCFTCIICPRLHFVLNWKVFYINTCYNTCLGTRAAPYLHRAWTRSPDRVNTQNLTLSPNVSHKSAPMVRDELTGNDDSIQIFIVCLQTLSKTL